MNIVNVESQGRLHFIVMFLMLSVNCFLIISCSDSNDSIKYLTSADSLDFDMSFAMDLTVIDDRLYVADEFNGIYMYNVDDLSLISKFGNEGRGPGEFFQVVSITGTEDSILYVCDIGNSRVSLFDYDGKYISEFSNVRTDNLIVSGGNVYCRDFGYKLIPDNKIYKLSKDKIEEYSRFEKYFKEDQNGRSFWLEDDCLFASTYKDNQFSIKYFEEGESSRILELVDLDLKYDDGTAAYICGSNDNGIWLFINGNKYGKEIQYGNYKTNVEACQSCLVLINKNGKVLKQYELPEKHRIFESSVVITDEYVFIVDIRMEKIYKYTI